MAMNLPVLIVVTVLAFACGKANGNSWLNALAQAAITFVCVLIGGLCFSGVGQIVGIGVSAVIIFIFFSLPNQKKHNSEAMRKEMDRQKNMNEEDS